mmetsp:Transcript_34215/g.98647  ORF Transcript_34215/g.98647 Transcript_34215/m.98647 type:complete len:181 (+) Transcript_34215:85-627(+)
MLIPMPAVASPGGPPSQYLLSVRPYMLAILIVQSLACILQVFYLLEILQGFINTIALALGWYAWKQDMNITFICYWGMMGLINGSFDLVRFIDAQVHYGGPIFTKDDMPRNIMSAVHIFGPLSFIGGAVFAYRAYNRYDTPVAEATSGAWGRDRDSPSTYGATRQSFQTFHGQGQRLGNA